MIFYSSISEQVLFSHFNSFNASEHGPTIFEAWLMHKVYYPNESMNGLWIKCQIVYYVLINNLKSSW